MNEAVRTLETWWHSGDQVVESITEHLSWRMLEHHSHIRLPHRGP